MAVLLPEHNGACIVAFVPVPITAKFELRFLRNQQQVENVINFSVPGGWDDAKLASAAGAAQAYIVAHWLTSLPTDTTFTEVVATDISAVGGSQYIASAPTGSAGLDASDPLPNEVSIAVRLRAATGGRSGAGRLFWVGITRSQMADTNNITSGIAGVFITNVTGLFSAITTAVPNSYPVVVSRVQHKVHLTTGIAYAIKSVSLFDRLVDSQTRRKPGRGV